jgi:hypothetical protein
MGKNTKIDRFEDGYRYQLYDTVIVSAGHGIYQLNSGGHQTATTKRHMNLCLDEIGAKVVQSGYKWYVHWQGRRFFFDDGMMIDTNTGTVRLSGYVGNIKAA